MTSIQKKFLEKKLSKLCEKYNDSIIYSDICRDDYTEDEIIITEINSIKCKIYLLQIEYIKKLLNDK